MQILSLYIFQLITIQIKAYSTDEFKKKNKTNQLVNKCNINPFNTKKKNYNQKKC